MAKKTNFRWLGPMVSNCKLLLFACLVSACLVTSSGSVLGQNAPSEKHVGHEQHAMAVAADKKDKKAEFALPDVEVLDQNGQKRRFYKDLVKGRKVVINFIYTSCKAVCPMAGAHFAKLQGALGDKLGREVFMISVTTDPETDSPARLKEWSNKYKPAAGWRLVTGSKKDITSLLLVLTGDGTQTGYHIPAIFLIDDRKKSHRWIYGLTDPAEITGMMGAGK